MYVMISFTMAVAPALLLLWYYYKQDKEKPEPKELITKIFFLGIASTIPAIIIELVVDKFVTLFWEFPLLFYFLKAFVAAALVEESLKLFVVKKFAYKNIYFDEVMDGIVYTIVASLGFACFENILYVMGSGLGVALIRAFTAVPLHALAAGIMGFYIGKAKFAKTKTEETALILKGFWLAVLIHGLYDFFLFAMPVLTEYSGLLVIPLLIICFFFLRKKIKLAIAEDIAEGRTVQTIPSIRGMIYGRKSHASTGYSTFSASNDEFWGIKPQKPLPVQKKEEPELIEDDISEDFEPKTQTGKSFEEINAAFWGKTTLTKTDLSFETKAENEITAEIESVEPAEPLVSGEPPQGATIKEFPTQSAAKIETEVEMPSEEQTVDTQSQEQTEPEKISSDEDLEPKPDLTKKDDFFKSRLDDDFWNKKIDWDKKKE